MNLEHTLIDLGLNDKEAQIYLALLELGETTVLPLAKKSNVTRTYCYDILAALQKRGLVSFLERSGRRRYAAEDPRALEQLFKLKLQNLEVTLPELRSIYNMAPGKPKVRYYEGLEGLIMVYNQLAEASSLDSIGSPEHIEKYLGSHFGGKQIIPKQARIRDLVASDGRLGWYHQHYLKPHQEYRFLPKETNLSTDLLIFNNKLALISYQDGLQAVVIEDSAIVETHKALFKILWQACVK